MRVISLSRHDYSTNYSSVIISAQTDELHCAGDSILQGESSMKPNGEGDSATMTDAEWWQKCHRWLIASVLLIILSPFVTWVASVTLSRP